MSYRVIFSWSGPSVSVPIKIWADFSAASCYALFDMRVESSAGADGPDAAEEYFGGMP